MASQAPRRHGDLRACADDAVIKRSACDLLCPGRVPSAAWCVRRLHMRAAAGCPCRAVVQACVRHISHICCEPYTAACGSFVGPRVRHARTQQLIIMAAGLLGLLTASLCQNRATRLDRHYYSLAWPDGERLLLQCTEAAAGDTAPAPNKSCARLAWWHMECGCRCLP